MRLDQPGRVTREPQRPRLPGPQAAPGAGPVQGIGQPPFGCGPGRPLAVLPDALPFGSEHPFDGGVHPRQLAVTANLRARWPQQVRPCTRFGHSTRLSDLIEGVLAAARDDQHAPSGKAYDDANKHQRVHGQVGADDRTRRASGDKRESAKHDQVDPMSAQARPRALATAGVPSCAVPHRHRLRILPWLTRPLRFRCAVSSAAFGALDEAGRGLSGDLNGKHQGTNCVLAVDLDRAALPGC